MAETTIIQWGSKIPLRPSSGTNWCSLPANNYGTGTNIGYTSWCIHPCLHMPPSLSSSQKKRNELLTTIYHDIRNKDWSNPSIADQVDQSFTTRAKELWGGPNSDSENWILDGNWLDKRPDTVTWSRSTFWKNNKRKLRAAALGGDEYGSDAQSPTGPPLADALQAIAQAAQQQTDENRNWSDVVLQ